MNKKTKKRIDLLNVRKQKLRQQLAGAKQQMDDPDEVTRLETELAEVDAELTELKEQK